MADGTIIIDTTINSDGAKDGLDEIANKAKWTSKILEKILGKGLGIDDLTRSCKTVVDSLTDIGETAKYAAKKSTEAFVEQAMALQKLDEDAHATRERVDEKRAEVSVLDELVKKTKEHIEALEKEKAERKRNGVINTSDLDPKITESYNVLAQAYRDLTRTENELSTEEEALLQKESEIADTTPRLIQEYDALNAELLEYIQQQIEAEKAAANVEQRQREEEQAVSEQEGTVSRGASAWTYFVSATKKAIDCLSNGKNAFDGINQKVSRLVESLVSAGDAAKKSNKGFSFGLKTLLMYGIGVNSITALIGKMRNAIIGGFKKLAEYSSDVNNSLSSMSSSLSYLKNSLSAAFAPILNTIAPILTTLINLLATAISYVNAFFAALSGARTFVKAKNVQQDYAKSLGGTAGGAKKAADATEDLAEATEKYLSPLDTINKMDSSKDSKNKGTSGAGGGGGAGGASDIFETAEIPSMIDDLADRFSKLFEPLKNAWDTEGSNTIEAATYAFGALKQLASDVALSVATVWTNGTGQEVAEALLRITQDIFNTIGNILARLDAAWTMNGVGTGIVQGIFNAYKAVLGVVEDITQATQDWSATLDFYPLLSAIKSLFDELSPLISTIGGILAQYYETIILPLFTKLIEEWLPWLIQLVSEFFAFLAQHQGLLEVIGALLIGAFAASIIVPAITAIVGAISLLIGTIESVIGVMTGGGGFATAIALIVAKLGVGGVLQLAITGVIALIVLLITHWDKIKAKMEAVGKWLKETFTKTWEKVHSGMYDKSNGFFGSLGEIWEGVKKIFKGIGDFLTGAFTGDWDKAWNGILEIVQGVFESIVGVAKGAVNSVIEVINGMINGAVSGLNAVVGALNSISVSIPSWVPKYGGQRFGISIPTISAPQIPYLASGAVIPPNAPFTAVLGDQRSGNNIETPERLLRQIVKEESGGNGNYRFTATINRRVLFDEMITEAKLRQQSSGRNPMLLGG